MRCRLWSHVQRKNLEWVTLAEIKHAELAGMSWHKLTHMKFFQTGFLLKCWWKTQWQGQLQSLPDVLNWVELWWRWWTMMYALTFMVIGPFDNYSRRFDMSSSERLTPAWIEILWGEDDPLVNAEVLFWHCSIKELKCKICKCFQHLSPFSMPIPLTQVFLFCCSYLNYTLCSK